MKRTYFLVIASLFFSSFIYSENNLAITTSNLNIRSQNNANSAIISVINKGDTVEIINQLVSWTEIKHKEKTGFVSSKYLNEIEINKSPKKSGFKDQKGFLAGFKFVFINFFIVTFFILGTIKTYQLRKKDARFKKGFREGDLSGSHLFRVIIICVLISLIAAIIGGIISIFH